MNSQYNLEDVKVYAEQCAQCRNIQYAVFHLHPNNNPFLDPTKYPAEYRVGVANDAGYHAIGREIYRTKAGRIP